MITKEQITPKNVCAFIQGFYRYFLMMHFPRLMRKHIKAQINARLCSMDHTCLMQGQCRMCGCKTPELAFADKACDKPCYPEMMNRRLWLDFCRSRGNAFWAYDGYSFTPKFKIVGM